MDEWLIRPVMALYTEDYTVVRIDDGRSENFKVNVGLHQGSLLSQLLFAVVMGVVSNELINGIPSDFLYADDLALWY